MVSLPELTGPELTTQTEPPGGSHFAFGIWPKRQSFSVAGTNVSMGIVGQAAGIHATGRSGERTGRQGVRSRDSQKNGGGAVDPDGCQTRSSAFLSVGSGSQSVSLGKPNNSPFFCLDYGDFCCLPSNSPNQAIPYTECTVRAGGSRRQAKVSGTDMGSVYQGNAVCSPLKLCRCLPASHSSQSNYFKAFLTEPYLGE